jgi:polyribonucleotide nucleotidyltransferase
MSENIITPAPHQVTVEVGGRPLVLKKGKIAKQANGAITARYGDTVVLTTACMASAMNDRDFLPLTVDYRENTYSAGKIPGGFFKREGRPSEKEVLTSRLIDRPMRPLFPESWRNETQIVSMVLSADSENDPDVIAVTSASAAAYCSDLPFGTPIAAVRVGLVDGQLVINPTVQDQKKSLMNIIIADSTKLIICVSLRQESGNSGRIGRSINLEVKTSFSDGRPSRLKNPPGIFPAE